MAEADRDSAALKTARPIETTSARDEAVKLGTPRPVHDFKLANTPDDRYDFVYIGSASPGVDAIAFAPPQTAPNDPVVAPPLTSGAALAASGDANALRTLSEIPSPTAAPNTASTSFSSRSPDIAAERHKPGSSAVAGTAYGDPESIASSSVDKAPQAVAAEQAEAPEQRPPGGENARPELPNQAPTSLQAALVPTAEDAAAGTVVGELSTLDPDRRDSHSYEIVGGNPLFQIDGDLITLKPGAHLNFETQSSYELVIRSTDPAGNSIVKTVIVHVTDADEFDVSPVSDINAASNAVAENAANGTTVGIAAFASDADGSNNGVSYSLTDNAGGRFAINAATGVVTVADGSQLNYESAASHQITVQAASADGSSSTQSFTVSLTDADEFNVSPVSDSNAAANAVAENAANGTTVGIAAFASDADGSNNGVSYSLTDNAGGRFAINAATGVVTVADGSQLNYESVASHQITVQATSADGSTATQNFTINLTDADEFDVSPVSDSNAAANSVAENAANGTTVGIAAFASDADGSNNGVSYSLVTAGAAPVSGGPFAINATTGVVTVADHAQLDYETATSPTLYVKAASADGSASTQSFSINVTNAFDVAPNDMDFVGNDALSSSNVLRLNNGATNQYGMASNFTDFPTQALTAEIRFTSSNLGTHDTPLISYNASGSDNEFLLIGQSSTNKLGVYINGAPYTTGISLPSLFDGSQHMLSVSWNMQSGALKVYVDGVQKYSATASVGVPITGGGTLVLGQEQDTVGGGFNSTQIFEGTIDEVRIFNYVRTGQEIASNVANRLANPSSVSGLVSNWQMNASGGGAVIDEAGTHNLTLYSGASLQGVVRAGTIVADVSSVTDVEVGDSFTYSLTDNAGGKYAINSSTGEISLVNSHSISAVDSHTVTVMATDAGGNSYSETLGIHLGTAGADTISGTAYFDVMYGLAGDDNLNGGSGKDVLYGGAGNDTLQGGVGNDTLHGGTGADVLDGGGGIDTADYSTSGSGVTVDLATVVGSGGDAAGDTLTGFENLTGSAYADDLRGDGGDNILSGGAGNDYLYGGSGADTLIGGTGNDTLDGGGGIDTADYSSATSGVTVDLSNAAAQNIGSSGVDTFLNIENVTGSAYNDTIIGDSGNNSISGGDGADYIDGGAGDDLIQFGNGGDIVHGGDGNDTIDDVNGSQLGNYADTLYGEAGNDILDGGRGNDTLYGDDGSDLFMFGSNGGMDTMYGGIAGGWTDVIQLTGSDGVGSAGVFGTDWTLQLTSGSIVSQDAYHIMLSQDADGHIAFDSSNQITFTDMERIDF